MMDAIGSSLGWCMLATHVLTFPLGETAKPAERAAKAQALAQELTTGAFDKAGMDDTEQVRALSASACLSRLLSRFVSCR